MFHRWFVLPVDKLHIFWACLVLPNISLTKRINFRIKATSWTRPLFYLPLVPHEPASFQVPHGQIILNLD